jgi:hypothetical protein
MVGGHYYPKPGKDVACRVSLLIKIVAMGGCGYYQKVGSDPNSFSSSFQISCQCLLQANLRGKGKAGDTVLRGQPPSAQS